MPWSFFLAKVLNKNNNKAGIQVFSVLVFIFHNIDVLQWRSVVPIRVHPAVNARMDIIATVVSYVIYSFSVNNNKLIRNFIKSDILMWLNIML